MSSKLLALTTLIAFGAPVIAHAAPRYNRQLKNQLMQRVPLPLGGKFKVSYQSKHIKNVGKSQLRAGRYSITVFGGHVRGHLPGHRAPLKFTGKLEFMASPKGNVTLFKPVPPKFGLKQVRKLPLIPPPGQLNR